MERDQQLPGSYHPPVVDLPQQLALMDQTISLMIDEVERMRQLAKAKQGGLGKEGVCGVGWMAGVLHLSLLRGAEKTMWTAAVSNPFTVALNKNASVIAGMSLLYPQIFPR